MFDLVEFEVVKAKFDTQTKNEISNILKEMKNEKISLEGWKLVEMPAKSTYCFYNPEVNKAFDFEPDDIGALRPHYYCEKTATTVTKFPAVSIRSAMEEYSL